MASGYIILSHACVGENFKQPILFFKRYLFQYQYIHTCILGIYVFVLIVPNRKGTRRDIHVMTRLACGNRQL